MEEGILFVSPFLWMGSAREVTLSDRSFISSRQALTSSMSAFTIGIRVRSLFSRCPSGWTWVGCGCGRCIVVVVDIVAKVVELCHAVLGAHILSMLDLRERS